MQHQNIIKLITNYTIDTNHQSTSYILMQIIGIDEQ